MKDCKLKTRIGSKMKLYFVNLLDTCIERCISLGVRGFHNPLETRGRYLVLDRQKNVFNFLLLEKKKLGR